MLIAAHSAPPTNAENKMIPSNKSQIRPPEQVKQVFIPAEAPQS
jgi:hypothetical protein